MADTENHALSDILDQLENSLEGNHISVAAVIDKLGHHSFASLMLVFSLVCVSPVSAIPGATSLTAMILFILTVQIILGRDAVWLPGLITSRQLSTRKLCKGIGWLRKPVRFVERFVKVRLTFLFHRPLFWVPLILVMCLTLFMPFMEFVPASGSIAAAIIALFAAGWLTRDGALVVVSLLFLMGIPVAVWFWADTAIS